MADEARPKKYLAPGTLDATRKNIGEIDPDEAQRMTKILGGDILTERPFDASSTPLSRTSKARHRAATPISKTEGSDKKAKDSSEKNSSNNNNDNKTLKTPTRGGGLGIESLPSVTAKEWAKMNRVMQASDYGIRRDYGLLNFLMDMTRNGKYKVSQEFLQYNVKNHIEHLQTFVDAIRNFVQMSPEAFRVKVNDDMDIKFKFLRTVSDWNVKELKLYYLNLEQKAKELFIPMFSVFERVLYRMLLSVFYLGEQRVPIMLKEILLESSSMTHTQKDKLSMLMAEAGSQWFYICTKIVRGHYPLLMRMCSQTYEPYPDFFQTRFANILTFLGVSKFDLLMPNMRPTNEDAEDETVKSEKSTVKHPTLGEKDDIVEAGFTLLQQLFPKAGFEDLQSMPDLYPYFQPIFDFQDGYNMLSPENPMLVVVVLLEIIEEFFQGCRNIHFNVENDDPLVTDKDNIATVLNEWSVYREELYDKSYNEDLKTYVNQLYSQEDYDKSQYAKKVMTNLLWEAKYNFLPHYKFQRLVLEQPTNEVKYRPLYNRTDYIRKLFMEFAKRIEKAQGDKGMVVGIENPWEKYVFDIPNNISKRLDVLLGAKKNNTNATNANLLKYTLCIISVLDWWINNEESPAYFKEDSKVFRISPEDGKPIFSVPLVKNQNQLFAQSIKDSIAKREV